MSNPFPRKLSSSTMSFHGYKANLDEPYCNWTPHTTTNGYGFGVEPHYSSPYELGESYPIGYTSSSAYYGDDYSEATEYTNSCDYYNYEYAANQPKFLQYEPTPHYHGYFPSETKFTISYSKVEFNEPEFEEFDPTPYGGGYDQRMTYGKPLPPSDLTCYPRSVPQPEHPNLENFSYDSIPSPYGKDDDIPVEPPKASKPKEAKGETESHVEDEGKVVSAGKEVEIVEPNVSGGYEDRNGDYGRIPYGSGLEAVDICESIFGYWPCIAKIERQEQQRRNCQVCDHDRGVDPWINAADYLFGNPLPYGYDSYHNNQSPYQTS